MENRKVKILVSGITLEGVDLEVGDEVTLPKHSASSLVKEELAEYMDDGLSLDVNDGEGHGDKLPGGGAAGQLQGQPGADNAAKISSAIDAKFKGNKEGLEGAAKSLGVEFKYDATRADIIEAVIAAGKAEAILV